MISVPEKKTSPGIDFYIYNINQLSRFKTQNKSINNPYVKSRYNDGTLTAVYKQS